MKLGVLPLIFYGVLACSDEPSPAGVILSLERAKPRAGSAAETLSDLPSEERRGFDANRLEIEFSAPIGVLEETRVTGADGRALEGVEVLAIHARVSEPPPLTVEYSRTAPRTDSQGRTRVRVPSDLYVAARVLGSELAYEQAGRITLPAVAEVRVLLPVPAGASRRGEAHVKVWVLGDSGGERKEVIGTVDASSGMARLFPVAAGTRLALHAIDGGHQGYTEVAAPSQDGAVLDVMMEMEETPTLHFKVVDLAGQPIAGLPLGVRLNSPDAAEFLARSTEGGQVVCALSEPLESRQLKQIYVREITTDSDEEGDPNQGRVAMVEAETAARGILDLGVLTLRSVPTILSGRVEDAEGNPVHDAMVWILSPPGVSRRRGRNAPPPFPGSWSLGTARSDRAGAFEIRMGLPSGLLPRETPFVDARARGLWNRSPVAFVPGQRDVVLVLERTGGVRVDASRYGATEMEGIQLLLRHSSGRSQRSLGFGHVREIEGLRPGTYDLYLRRGQGDDALLVEGLLVQPGRMLEDPRLVPLDVAPVHRPSGGLQDARTR